MHANKIHPIPPDHVKKKSTSPSSSFYIHRNSIVFHENSLFKTFIKNVCQWSIKNTPSVSEKNFPPPPCWSQKILTPPNFPLVSRCHSDLQQVNYFVVYVCYSTRCARPVLDACGAVSAWWPHCTRYTAWSTLIYYLNCYGYTWTHQQTGANCTGMIHLPIGLL